MLSPSGYVKIIFSFRDILRLWEYPGDLTYKTKKDNIRSLWEDICLKPLEKVLSSVIEAAMSAQTQDLNKSREGKNVGIKRRRWEMK